MVYTENMLKRGLFFYVYVVVRPVITRISDKCIGALCLASTLNGLKCKPFEVCMKCAWVVPRRRHIFSPAFPSRRDGKPNPHAVGGRGRRPRAPCVVSWVGQGWHGTPPARRHPGRGASWGVVVPSPRREEPMAPGAKPARPEKGVGDPTFPHRASPLLTHSRDPKRPLTLGSDRGSLQPFGSLELLLSPTTSSMECTQGRCGFLLYAFVHCFWLGGVYSLQFLSWFTYLSSASPLEAWR